MGAKTTLLMMVGMVGEDLRGPKGMNQERKKHRLAHAIIMNKKCWTQI
jgi:hypothetical protein